MTHTIIVNDKEFPAYQWFEAPLPHPGEEAPPPHARDKDLMETGIIELRPGEVSFTCDQSFVFDTPFTLKGDGRKFVIISHRDGRYVAKPY